MHERDQIRGPWSDCIPEPAQLEKLVQVFAMRSGVLPPGVHRVRDWQALPAAQRQALADAIPPVWVCFSNGGQSWLFTGVVSAPLRRERDAAVLRVTSYGNDGIRIEVELWIAGHHGRWRRCVDEAAEADQHV